MKFVNASENRIEILLGAKRFFLEVLIAESAQDIWKKIINRIASFRGHQGKKKSDRGQN